MTVVPLVRCADVEQLDEAEVDSIATFLHDAQVRQIEEAIVAGASWDSSGAAASLTAVERDAFNAGGGLGSVRFIRDAQGSVTQLSVRQARVYDLRFDRVRVRMEQLRVSPRSPTFTGSGEFQHELVRERSAQLGTGRP